MPDAPTAIPIGTKLTTEDGEGYVAQIQGDCVVVRGLPKPTVYSRTQVLDLLVPEPAVRHPEPEETA